jgi:hypothetical protein
MTCLRIERVIERYRTGSDPARFLRETSQER